MMNSIEIKIYTTKSGKTPFSEWLDDLDKQSQAIVIARLARVRVGNFGNCKALTKGQGIKELIIDHGPGYRIYYGIDQKTLVILLAGGTKRTQERDIEKAKRYWLDYEEAKL